jgi:hypothetical protein
VGILCPAFASCRSFGSIAAHTAMEALGPFVAKALAGLDGAPAFTVLVGVATAAEIVSAIAVPVSTLAVTEAVWLTIAVSAESGKAIGIFQGLVVFEDFVASS